MLLSNQIHTNGGFSCVPASREHQVGGHAWYVRESPTTFLKAGDMVATV